MATLSKNRIVLANQFGMQICEALGIDTDERCRAIVLKFSVPDSNADTTANGAW